MFLRHYKTKKIYGIEFGKNFDSGFHFVFTWNNPIHFYLYLLILPLPIIRWGHYGAGSLCSRSKGFDEWKWIGSYYLVWVGIKFSFIIPRPIPNIFSNELKKPVCFVFGLPLVNRTELWKQNRYANYRGERSK